MQSENESEISKWLFVAENSKFILEVYIMETILYTKNNDFVVKSCYFPTEACFATVLVFPNGEQMILERYNSIMNIMKKHDFWCKEKGLISTAIA